MRGTRRQNRSAKSIQIKAAPRKDNIGAIQTIVRNGGILVNEFFDDDIPILRYEIHLE